MLGVAVFFFLSTLTFCHARSATIAHVIEALSLDGDNIYDERLGPPDLRANVAATFAEAVRKVAPGGVILLRPSFDPEAQNPDAVMPVDFTTYDDCADEPWTRPADPSSPLRYFQPDAARAPVTLIEPVVIDKNVTILPKCGDIPVRLKTSTRTGDRRIIEIKHDNVHIEGLWLIGLPVQDSDVDEDFSRSRLRASINITAPVRNVTISSITFQYGSGISVQPEYGRGYSNLIAADGVVVRACAFENMRGYAMSLWRVEPSSDSEGDRVQLTSNVCNALDPGSSCALVVEKAQTANRRDRYSIDSTPRTEFELVEMFWIRPPNAEFPDDEYFDGQKSGSPSNSSKQRHSSEVNVGLAVALAIIVLLWVATSILYAQTLRTQSNNPISPNASKPSFSARENDRFESGNVRFRG